MALDPVDVCVVGSGAGGSPVALELSKAGAKVVVLEKGPHYTRDDFVHDEIAVCRRNFFAPFPWEEPHVFVRNGRKPEKSNLAWTANCVGGGTVHMSGYFFRLHPEDFHLKTLLGDVEDARLADWPIRYEDLQPYYDRAEAELGVSGLAGQHPFEEPRGPYPLPPLKAHPISNEVERVCKSLGYHPFPTPRGIVSEPYRGRSACSYCALCGSYGCEVDAKSSTLASLLPMALATGNCEIRARCMAKRIEVDKRGRAKSVVYVDPDGKEQEQPARVIVVSCTSIETARLLLNSTSTKFPKGLANNNQLVGRNLVFSSLGEGRAEFHVSKRKSTWPWLADRAPFVQRAMQDFYWLKDDTLGFRKGGTIHFVFRHPNPIHNALRLAGTGRDAVWGKALKERLKDDADTVSLQFEVFGEYFANDENYVDVDPDIKDKWGIPSARIHVHRHPTDLKSTNFLIERGMEVLNGLGPDQSDVTREPGETWILQHGTCRFGNDPTASVLDKTCRAHEVPNLYCVDGSFMPTSGGVPTTLTIVANSFRVADNLAGRFKRHEI
jgi:choline dehydrogenase-like flavoprotein